MSASQLHEDACVPAGPVEYCLVGLVAWQCGVDVQHFRMPWQRLLFLSPHQDDFPPLIGLQHGDAGGEASEEDPRQVIQQRAGACCSSMCERVGPLVPKYFGVARGPLDMDLHAWLGMP